MSLETLDFVFSAKREDGAWKKLAQTLQDSGFRTVARPGSETTVLVFARLSKATFADLVRADALKSFQVGLATQTDLAADRVRIVHSYLTSPKPIGVGLTPGKGDWELLEAIVPIAGYLRDKAVLTTAKRSLQAPGLVTLSLFETYGSDVAMYFEFLKHYTYGLAGLTAFGAVAYFKAKQYSLTYSFIGLLWLVALLVLWKRKERALVQVWGVEYAGRIEKHDAELSQLNAEKDEDDQTALPKARAAKESSRFVKELAFIPVALTFVAVLVSYQLACFVLEIFLAEIYDGPGKGLLTLVPTVLVAVFVPILTIVYNTVVDKFLLWESHDNNITRYNSFVIKSFTLNFLTGYVPLLITAFIYLPFAHLIEPNLPVLQRSIESSIHHDRYVYKYLTKLKSQHAFKINQGRLNGQFFFFMVTNSVIQLVLKYALPLVLPIVIQLVKMHVLGKKEKPAEEDAPEEKAWLDAVRKAVTLPEYKTHDDYRGLALQFGYLTMFGPVWTLAPLVAAVFNVITFKIDTYKLASGKYFRPPVPKRSDSIHPWDSAFVLLAWFGSVVSPLVTAFYRHGLTPPKSMGELAFNKASVNVSSTTLLMFTLFGFEHVFFVILFFGSKLVAKFSSLSALSLAEENAKFRGEVFAKEDPKISVDDYEWDEVSIKEMSKQAEGKYEPDVSTGILSGYGKKGSSDLARLQAKKAKLEEDRQKLEAKAGKGDRIVETVDADGNKMSAIMGSGNHIPMEDVEDIERKLLKNESDEESNAEEQSALEGKTSKKKSLKKLLKRGKEKI